MYNKNIEIVGINNGYYYFIDYEHPLSTGNSGRVYYHRHIVSVKIGRWITSDESVHHEDENKLNNDPTNLSVMTISEHAKHHWKERHNLPDDYEWFHSEEIKCKSCSQMFQTKHKHQNFCSVTCGVRSQPELYPISKEILSELVWKIPSTEIAKIYGCSDRTIGKKCKKYGIAKPPRGFWSSK